MPLEEKYARLREMLRGLGSVVIGFSGGADSALLTKVAHDELGDDALAVIALSESYPKRETDDALALAAAIGVPVLTVEARELDNEDYAANPTNRCYYCKAELFTHLSRVAAGAGHPLDRLRRQPRRPGRLPARPAGRAGVRRPRARCWKSG